MTKRKNWIIFSSLLATLIGMSFLILFFKDKHFSFNYRAIYLFRLPEFYTLAVGGTSCVLATYFLQLTTRNKIIDIGTIGLNSINLLLFTIIFAFVDATLYIWISSYVMPIIYIAASLGIMSIIYLLSMRKGNNSKKVLLIGIVFSLTLSAVIYFIQANLPNSKQEYIVNRSVGAIYTDSNYFASSTTIAATSILGISIGLIVIFYKKIMAVYADENKASTTGISVKKIRLIIFLIISLLSAASFMELGAISFLGFIAVNFSYVIRRKKDFIQMIFSVAIGLILLMVVYFIDISWLEWNIFIGVAVNIIAIPYLLFVLLRRT